MVWPWEQQEQEEGETAERSSALKRELLLAGITDTQGTIHANDAKCSAALITHGLLFAALVTVSASAAELYSDVSTPLRVAAVTLAAGCLIFFSISVICLLIAVRPYHPRDLARELREAYSPSRVFFPEPPQRPFSRTVDEQGQRVAALTPDEANLDLLCESLKLSEIRSHERRWAQRGYSALLAEVFMAAAYLSLVAAAALSTL